ncbi:phosphoglycerate mutase (2,3-diphosphoglycerate-independent) [Candidatus Woesebacteria bacterium RIFCSPLOWO2_01_FULL_39_23]|uniref:2,3-bisphosphoglycerate-independent phosphoglycerate mutase n=1 Tax=Candidatus Woesebacteria bacterium RIFCSPHIGHO2_01_FULL_40_22 TaxID=1802499 RepID=A0A1F7YIN6_9BACT|nr:MAG: phosphoglycerate mutase (2,3-diphosphoglycerate-independent) [Candidatus Woesebacteria bacterium RBG_16_40_11]OGM27050.1 MAG: phosphoglycerate mutase (2,3-diphosphoglycerate-independent) [Candidatus Woesebacteria bacterium RIFCSPHIGHO2_01_FULL_40_22]OGM36522.1 MAG: phosphoglycerate mutase (2,3-diphosphoglycerate-independent) [Candidatus Woesebacteria bacterium RIFCSPHIGHO2_12_FULL_38_9]OGM63285.1 MAG: phosphoglycerate mutase (2,3-diphosphoglycerate-independent) [Candidatus Woesebacteria 
MDSAKLRVLKIKPVVLLVLDGFGIAPESTGNAIAKANTPNLDNFKLNYPYTKLIASGESVGLPANEAGNSEVGHLTLGAGRVVYQSLPRINMSIKDGTYFENQALLSALSHARRHKSTLHIMGLVSSGSVHSSIAHLYALLELCQKYNFTRVLLHIFTDGRDAPPRDGVSVVEKLEKYLKETKSAEIASVCGRYWSMDRDARWERTKRAYDAIVSGVGIQATSASEAIQASYDKNVSDEFVEPTVIVKDGRVVGEVNDNDSVIFFNFRIDRPRQLTMAFVFPNFEELKFIEFGYTPHGRQKAKKEGEKATGPTFVRTKWPKNIFFVTLTEYQKNLPVSAIAFPPEDIKDTFSSVISKFGLKQLHLTESEKERMVTFYFDGLTDTKVTGEDTLIVPSPNVATYDKKPEMAVWKIVEEFNKAVMKDYYNFIVINFANPDMVAHSGNIKATIKAIEIVDKALGMVSETTLLSGGSLYLTADHGNAEELLTYPTGSFFYTTSQGSMNTEHSNNPVPLMLVDASLRGVKDYLREGSLKDVAPTILTVMGITIPSVMTGEVLLKKN